MRYCIPCHAEYAVNLHHCPDCGARTFSEQEHQMWLTAREEMTQEHFVPVHVFDGPVDKAILQELFSDAEVPFVVHDHGADVLQPLYAGAQGWGVLLVPEDDVEQARDLIRQFREAAVKEFED